jgi:hypothetical protein
VCAQCATPITDRYFTLGSHVLCESCHLAFQNAKTPGNATSRFFGAAALETAAAALAAIAATWALTQEGLLVLLGIGAAFQCFAKDAPENGDARGLASHAGLVISLALLSGIPVPGIANP